MKQIRLSIDAVERCEQIDTPVKIHHEKYLKHSKMFAKNGV